MSKGVEHARALRLIPDRKECGAGFVFQSQHQGTTMNRKQIDLDDASGKTITAVIESIHGDGVILAIGDDAFVLVEADGDEDGGELRFNPHDTSFNRHRYRECDLREVFSAATFAEWAAESLRKVADDAAKQEQRDRAEFERLKAKFNE